MHCGAGQRLAGFLPKMATMLTVHHLETSRSQRILWLLEELGVPYKLKVYARDPRTRLAPAALRKVHPLGKSPVITDKGETIAESGAIIEYLVETYGASATGDMAHLQPAPGTPEHRRCRFWMHYAEGSLMNWLVMKLVFASIPGQPQSLKSRLGTVGPRNTAEPEVNKDLP